MSREICDSDRTITLTACPHSSPNQDQKLPELLDAQAQRLVNTAVPNFSASAMAFSWSSRVAFKSEAEQAGGVGCGRHGRGAHLLQRAHVLERREERSAPKAHLVARLVRAAQLSVARASKHEDY